MKLLYDLVLECGESPVWHPDEKALYFVDNDAGVLHRDGVEVFRGPALGALTVHRDGRLLLFMAGGKVMFLHGETLLEWIAGEEESRFNDVLADPEGRVFAGTMPVAERPGRLYRLDPDGTLRVLLEEAGQPNGMAFSPDGRFFYLTDTWSRRIERFHYDRVSGELDSREVLLEVPPGQGSPDGLTVDAEGCLWSARWDGGRLVRYSPEGEELGSLAVPVRNVTCLTFGGEDLREMFVTTAGGGVYRQEADVPGLAEFRSG